MTDVVQALKQLALEYNVAVVAIAAADKAGIQSPRLRLPHFRGSSALMYEADIAVIMNDKWQIIDRDHLVFNQFKAEQHRDWVVCTIEKNRSGRNLVDLEFRKQFEYLIELEPPPLSLDMKQGLVEQPHVDVPGETVT